jgi:hypothetical protein
MMMTRFVCRRSFDGTTAVVKGVRAWGRSRFGWALRQKKSLRGVGWDLEAQV